MTAPLVTPSRDALADFLAAHDAYRVNEEGWTVCICGHVAVDDDDDGSHARHLSDALLASGVVRDPATLAESLCKLLCDMAGEPRLFIPSEIRAILAAALSEGPA